MQSDPVNTNGDRVRVHVEGKPFPPSGHIAFLWRANSGHAWEPRRVFFGPEASSEINLEPGEYCFSASPGELLSRVTTRVEIILPPDPVPTIEQRLRALEAGGG